MGAHGAITTNSYALEYVLLLLRMFLYVLIVIVCAAPLLLAAAGNPASLLPADCPDKCRRRSKHIADALPYPTRPLVSVLPPSSDRERGATDLIKSNGGRWKHGEEMGRAIKASTGGRGAGTVGGRSAACGCAARVGRRVLCAPAARTGPSCPQRRISYSPLVPLISRVPPLISCWSHSFPVGTTHFPLVPLISRTHSPLVPLIPHPCTRALGRTPRPACGSSTTGTLWKPTGCGARARLLQQARGPSSGMRAGCVHVVAAAFHTGGASLMVEAPSNLCTKTRD